jgi:hypothetical protein
MEWFNGSQSADRHGLLPGFLTAEAQLRATPRPRFPTLEIRPLYQSCSLTNNLYYSSQPRRIRTPPDEFNGAFSSKEPIVFDRDGNTMFQSLNLVRLHGAPELFDQGAAPVPKFA